MLLEAAAARAIKSSLTLEPEVGPYWEATVLRFAYD